MKLELIKKNISPLDVAFDSQASAEELDYFRFFNIDFENHFEGLSHNFGNIQSSGYDIAVHYYQLADAEGSCFIVHGYYDHSGLYGKIIEYCLKRKMSVVIFDLPGHGLSTGEQASINSFSEYQTVLSNVVEKLAKTAPKPWYAIGQSTGGAILMDFMLSAREPVFAKTVLLAPLLRPTRWPVLALAHNVVNLVTSHLSRRFVKNSHDVEFLEFLENRDPLQARKLSLQWVTAMKHWIKYFLHLRVSDEAPLIIQGKEDTTVDWQYNIQEIQKKFPNSKLYYLNNGRHHLANESEEIMLKTYSAMDMYFDVFIH